MWPSTQSMHHPLKLPYDSVVDEPHNWVTKAHFTLGVKANVQLKSSIPIGAKVEITSPKGFLYTRSQGWNRKNKIFSICPKVLINAELYYGLVKLAARLEKRIPSYLGSQFATLGAYVPAFIGPCLHRQGPSHWFLWLFETCTRMTGFRLVGAVEPVF